MWCDLDGLLDEFGERFDVAAMRYGGGFHYVDRKGRKPAKEDRTEDKCAAQAKYRASLLTDEEMRRARLAAKAASERVRHIRLTQTPQKFCQKCASLLPRRVGKPSMLCAACNPRTRTPKTAPLVPASI